MKFNFNLLYPDLPIDPDESFMHASSLHFHKDDGPEVLQSFADEGICWSSGAKATDCQEIMHKPSYEWYEIDCWIGREGHRDICWSGYVRCPTHSPQERRYALEDVLIELEPPTPLSLDSIFS